MAITNTQYGHIVLDEANTPLIAGTTLKVVELIAETIAYGWSPEEIHFQHAYLTLGQIHSALAYYWDHRDDLDAEIERRLRRVDQLKSSASPSPLLMRLKSQGLI